MDDTVRVKIVKASENLLGEGPGDGFRETSEFREQMVDAAARYVFKKDIQNIIHPLGTQVPYYIHMIQIKHNFYFPLQRLYALFVFFPPKKQKFSFIHSSFIERNMLKWNAENNSCPLLSLSFPAFPFPSLCKGEYIVGRRRKKRGKERGDFLSTNILKMRKGEEGKGKE